jgi:hypothetical protein
MNNTITFELGDIAYDPHYEYKGVVIELKNVDGMDYIILKDPNKQHPCSSKLRTQSINGSYPSYLQLICKKEEYDSISKLTIFGH